MHPSQTVANKVLKRFRRIPGEILSSTDFNTFGSRAAVSQALSRLTRQGTLKRVSRGLYELPREPGLLSIPRTQSPDTLVRAWARKNGLRVVPSDAHAANLLGLSTQVPAKIVYYSNGPTRKIKAGPYSVKLLHRGPKTMDIKSQISRVVIQALRCLGKGGVTKATVARLRSGLHPRDLAELSQNVKYAPAWMIPILNQITNDGER